MQIWNGDESVATWTAVGKNRPSKDNSRSYSNMFDNNDLTYWHGFEPATLNNKVIVSFKNTILFHTLVFTARSDVIHSQERYRGVCLYLDNAKSACTPRHRDTKPGDKIELNPLKVTEVKTVELRYPAHVAAAIAELQIDYNFANDANSALNANAIVNVASQVENVILETANDAAIVDTANNANILSQGASNTIDDNANDLIGETTNNIGTTAGLIL